GAGPGGLGRSPRAPLPRCERPRLAPRGPAGDCLGSPRVVAALAARRGHLGRVVSRACGGADQRCGTADDEPLASLGWRGETCPGAATDPSCPTAVTDCGGLAACVACRAVAGARSLEGYYAMAGGGNGEAKRRTQAGGGGAGRVRDNHGQALRAGWGRQLGGNHGGDWAVEPKTAAAIAKARPRQQTAVCRVCGGADPRCDGVNDVDASRIAFPQGCPAQSRADGASCGRAIHDVSDVV